MYQKLCRGQWVVPVLIACVLGLAGAPAALAADGPIRVGGTGGAMGLMARLGEAFATEAGSAVAVVPSLGTSGGLRATVDRLIDLAVVGRALTAAESNAGLRQVLSLQTPYVLATSQRDPPGVAAGDVARLFGDPKAAWPDGRPVRVVLRPTGESDYLVLFALFPGTEQAVAGLRHRNDIPLAATDQDNQEIAEQVPGSLTGTTLTQMLTEHHRLSMVPIDGISPSVATLQDGRYRFHKHLYFIVRSQAAPEVERLLAFVRSPHGQAVLREAGAALDDE